VPDRKRFVPKNTIYGTLGGTLTVQNFALFSFMASSVETGGGINFREEGRNCMRGFNISDIIDTADTAAQYAAERVETKYKSLMYHNILIPIERETREALYSGVITREQLTDILKEYAKWIVTNAAGKPADLGTCVHCNKVLDSLKPQGPS
jgi:hypothetical protein